MTIPAMNMSELLANCPRKQKLLTKAILTNLPSLGATDGTPLPEKVAVVKYFTPASNLTWYAFEYSPEERLFFGLVVGQETEMGYFSLDELESMNAAIERDYYFSPTKMKDILKD